MDRRRHAGFAQGVVGGLQRRAGGQHGVDEHECAAFHRGRAEVFDFNVKPGVVVLSVGRHKRRVCAIPHVKHPLVQGHGRPEDAGHHGLMGRNVFGGGSERRRARGLRHGPRLRQCAAQFTPHPLHVPAEGRTVVVTGGVAQVQQELACHAGRAVQDVGRGCHVPKVTLRNLAACCSRKQVALGGGAQVGGRLDVEAGVFLHKPRK